MNEKQEKTWNSSKCRNIYNKLIECAGGLDKVTKEKRAEAKQLAIRYCVNNKPIDYEKFKTSTKNNK